MNITALRRPVRNSLAFPSQDATAPVAIQRARHGRAMPQSVEDKGIIIGSTLGGTALVLVCLALILYPLWQRRRTPPSAPPKRTPSRLSKSCPSPMPRPRDVDLVDLHRVRPVTPSPRRLALDGSVPLPAHPFYAASRGWKSWDVEKATVHAPSGHPAIVWRSDMLGNDSPTVPKPEELQTRYSEPSISTTFAAEMSSLLESISIKSSYSSLRSGGAVLGVPAQLQTPLSVQKLRQDSCVTSVGATRGSVSDGGVVCGPITLSRVASTSSPRNEDLQMHGS